MPSQATHEDILGHTTGTVTSEFDRGPIQPEHEEDMNTKYTRPSGEEEPSNEIAEGVMDDSRVRMRLINAADTLRLTQPCDFQSHRERPADESTRFKELELHQSPAHSIIREMISGERTSSGRSTPGSTGRDEGNLNLRPAHLRHLTTDFDDAIPEGARTPRQVQFAQ